MYSYTIVWTLKIRPLRGGDLNTIPFLFSPLIIVQFNSSFHDRYRPNRRNLQNTNKFTGNFVSCGITTLRCFAVDITYDFIPQSNFFE